MSISRRRLLGTGASAMVLAPNIARAAAPTIRIGLLADLVGPYRDVSGTTQIACMRQAIEEFDPPSRGFNVDLLVAEAQNKADIAAGIVHEWIDRDDVDVIFGGNSAQALAANTIAHEKRKIYMNSTAATRDLTGTQCTPNTIKWSYDSYMQAKSTAAAVVKAGGASWFFITANYAFGHQLMQDATRVVVEAGGKVLGSALYPFPETSDFSAHLFQAIGSGADVVAFANGGVDLVNCVKQAREFRIGTARQKLVALAMVTQVAHELGLPAAQGMLLTESFYWDLNDRTRAFMTRLLPRTPNNYPNMFQAGAYAAVLHYLKAAADIGVAGAKADGSAVVARMKAMPFDDDAFGRGVIRADGRALVPAYLFQIKAPTESKGPWDLYKLLATTPGEDAAIPLAEGGCPLVKA